MSLIHESFQHLVLALRISHPASKAVQLSIHDTFPLGASHASTGNNLQARHPQHIYMFSRIDRREGGCYVYATTHPLHKNRNNHVGNAAGARKWVGGANQH